MYHLCFLPLKCDFFLLKIIVTLTLIKAHYLVFFWGVSITWPSGVMSIIQCSGRIPIPHSWISWEFAEPINVCSYKRIKSLINTVLSHVQKLKSSTLSSLLLIHTLAKRFLKVNGIAGGISGFLWKSFYKFYFHIKNNARSWVISFKPKTVVSY